MTKDTGGMAFPNPALADEAYSLADDDFGMSLRDYFAAKAMAALIGRYNDEPYEDLAAGAYAAADAMLEARK